MHYADQIVAPNGAACCNSLFCSNSNISIIYPSSHIDDYYFRVSMSLGLEFNGILAQQASDLSLSQLIHAYYYPSVADDYHLDSNRLKNLLLYIR